MIRTPAPPAARAPAPPAAASDAGGGSLYRLYAAALAGLARKARRQLPAGPDLDAALTRCRPLPWEHFEARWARLSADPRAAAAYRVRLAECAGY